MERKNDPAITVLIAVIDPDPVYFPLAVGSVLTQHDIDFELLIIEEPSERRVKDVLRGVSDDRIRHFYHSHRTSLVEQRNRGIELARSEFIAVLDADDICMPHRLEKQLRFMRENPHVAVVGGQLEIIDSRGLTIGYRKYPTSPDAVERALRTNSPIAQPSVMLRKSAVLTAGGYQLNFAEDYDLWCSMVSAGFKLANMPDILIKYRVHRDGGKAKKTKSILRATIAIKEKYYKNKLSIPERLRIIGEKILLILPATLIVKLFLFINTQRHLPRFEDAQVIRSQTAKKSDAITDNKG